MLYATMKTDDGWFVLFGTDIADPSLYQGWDAYVTGRIKYDGCWNDDSAGPFDTEEEAVEYVDELEFQAADRKIGSGRP